MAEFETVDDLKVGIAKLWEDGKKIASHYKRLEKEYDDWQDRLYEIEKLIAQAEEDTGLTKEEIIAPTREVDEFLDELGIE